MLKKVVSVLSSLLLMLAMLIPAHADETEIVSLGTFTAGEAVDIFINRTTGGSAELSSGELSRGMELITENREEGTCFYLRGTPVTAGSFSFTLRFLDGSGAFIAESRYSLSINAARPVLSYEQNINVPTGASVLLSVNASTTDAGVLSCRWFSGTGGDSMTVIQGQTGFSVVPDTSKQGTFYYRCEVTNSNNAVQATTLTEMICVTVLSPELTGISINTMPVKQEYNKGENVSTEGLRLSLSYSDGTAQTVSEGFTVSPLVLENEGTQKITVSYKNFTCSYPVLVSAAEEVIRELKVVSLPNRTEYAPGETISLDGLKIRVITDRETRDIITGFFCTPTTFYEEGKQTVTVFYGDSQTSFDITVKISTPSPTPSPTPIHTPASSPVPVSTPTPQNAQTPSGENSGTLDELPASDEPEEIRIPEGAVPEKQEDSDTRSVSRLTVAIVVIAMVALACLGIYAYIMQDPKARRAMANLISKIRK